MRKKHDKIVLKSDVFKAKTPDKAPNSTSRSPISRSPYLSKKEEEKIDPSELFQKVCCPNCRFIFKIIKNSEGLLTANSRRKDKQVNEMTQTQETLLRESSEIKSLSIDLVRRLSPDPEHQIIKNSYLKSEMYQINEHPSESEIKDEPSFKLHDLSATSKLPPNKSSLRSSIKQSQRHLSQSSFFENSKILYQKERPQQENKSKDDLKAVISQLYLNSKTNEVLISLFKELPTTMEIPAYHKMLLESDPPNQLKT